QRVNGSWIKTGWVQGGENLVGNTTWFDYTGKALPVFEAIAEAAAIDQAGVHETVVTRDDAARGLSAYNLAGQREDASRKGLVIINGKKQFNR
ncbi:MAG: hypothetical protein ACSW8D_15615, partial [Prevotella sp.]